ncbi:MAG: hypothetical protein AM326_09305 [Candidatus Thorarchaeota archaeon SMTZ-45]|nr:MAG: hypothetical protein AM326_09305 [Candidatus Thorarchaeota archaeon SMTZ-45]
MSQQLSLLEETPEPLLRLDLGCGPNPRTGFEGVDERNFPGVTHVVDLRKPWPWKDSTVSEAHCSHFIEHLEALERVHFVNELHRVLVPGGSCFCVTPHWSSCRAYGDLTHKWPPVSEFWFYYLDAEWRKVNAPHNDFYKCDFAVTGSFNLHPLIATRNLEYQQHAVTFWKEATPDIVFTLVKR